MYSANQSRDQALPPVSRPGWPRLLDETRASQLVEFALVLPLLIVMVVAIADFGAGFVLKDKMTYAVREGARVGANQPNDLTQGSPPASVTTIRNAVSNYLTNAGVTTCTIDTTATKGTTLGKWNYGSGSAGCSTMELEIERATLGSSGCTIVSCTKVTLHYPYAWRFGRVIKMLKPGATYPDTLKLSAVKVMPNFN